VPEKYDAAQETKLMTEILELLVTHHGGAMTEEELDFNIALLQKGFDLASKSHAGQVRKSGEPYIFHPLRVAHLAARHWMEFPSIIAALLHDVVEDTPVTLEDVKSDFGDIIARLVNGLTKVENTEQSVQNPKTETYRKQLLAAIDDVRVLCLKLWDRIDNMRTISALKPEKQMRIAEETRSIYVPLAQHLGMGYVATELEAMALQVLYPRRTTRYQIIVDTLKEDISMVLNAIRSKINHSLEHQKIQAVIRDRWRAFSIQAAREVGRGISSLYTMEIFVDRTMDAYIVLGVLHGHFQPIPGKLRDHINVPSQFGYQAIKTTVQAGEHRMRFEITTRKLARFNESGVLAPGFKFRKDNFEGLMRSLMEGGSAFDPEQLRLASASIQVYTPQGDTCILPEGSSALDFAFDIHETLGLKAVRVKINGKTRMLRSRLVDGDQVEVEVAKTFQALPKWLDWAATPRARNSIRRYLRNKIKE